MPDVTDVTDARRMKAIEMIETFSDECDARQHTDVGEVWLLFDALKALLEDPPDPDPARCPKSEDGMHVPDPESQAVAPGADWIVYVWCSRCGTSGSMATDPASIMW